MEYIYQRIRLDTGTSHESGVVATLALNASTVSNVTEYIRSGNTNTPLCAAQVGIGRHAPMTQHT